MGWRRTEDHPAAGGDARRDTQHQHRGEQRGAAAGDIQADGIQGAGDLTADHPRLGLNLDVAGQLSAVETGDIVRRLTHGAFQRFQQGVCGGVTRLWRHAQLLGRNAVEPLAEAAQGGVTILAHFLEDRRDAGADLGGVVDGRTL
ncbi:Uncharacterised protein [Edwardsiella tarda]|nr:Uncharacterised protein [Edwardsiella tarda]